MNQNVNNPYGPRQFDWRAAPNINQGSGVPYSGQPAYAAPAVDINQYDWRGGNMATGAYAQTPLGQGPLMPEGYTMNTPPPTASQFDWGGLASGLQAGSSLVNAYTGIKQLGLAEDQFDFQKQAYAQNLANQSKLTNARLEDRQNARRSAGGSYEATDSYMQKYKV